MRTRVVICLLILACREQKLAPPANPADVVASMSAAIGRATAVQYDFDIRVTGAQRKEVRELRGNAILTPRSRGPLRVDATRQALEGESATADHYVIASDGETVTMMSEAKRGFFVTPMHRAGGLLLQGRTWTATRPFVDEWKNLRTAGVAQFDGVTCDVLRGDLPDDKKRVELAVGQKDHLPRRLLVQSADGDVDTRLTHVQAINHFDAKNLKVDAPPEYGSREYTLGGPAVGDPAPPWTLDVHGKRVSLASLKGKVVILDFWATWCGPCRASIPELQKIYSTGGVQVIGATWNEKGDPDAFAKKIGITYPHADGNAIAAAYGVDNSGIPTMYIIDRDGRVADFFLGWSGEETARRLRESLSRL